MKISVALCTYNGEKYLAAQIESILNQTIQVDEIVVCDDSSTDETLDIATFYNTSYPGKFRLIKNETNVGAKRNFEKALSLASGDFIFLCDQDDLWLPHKVATVLEAFEADTRVRGIFSNGFLINEKNEVLADDLWNSVGFTPRMQQAFTRDNCFEFLMKYLNVVTGATLCVKREALEGLFPFVLPYDGVWHDYWIALKLASQNKLALIDDKLIYYRLHTTQQVGLSTGFITKFAEAREANWFNLKKPSDLNTLIEYQYLIYSFMAKFWDKLPLSYNVMRRRLRFLMKQQKKQVLRNYYNHLPWPNKKLFLLKRYIRGTSPVPLTFWDVVTI